MRYFARLALLLTCLWAGTTLAGTSFGSTTQDPAVGAWTPSASMSMQRGDHQATLLPSGKVLVSGGHGIFYEYAAPSISYMFESRETTTLYDPETRSWSAAAPMLDGRHRHQSSLLASGKVLVTGGQSESIGMGTILHLVTPIYYASAELYDPLLNTWVAAESMHTARARHSATLMPSGQLLVVGGAGAAGPLASVELYEPLTGTWRTVTSLTTARRGHTATLLPSGKVLVTGGYLSDTLATATAELYDPATDHWSAATSTHAAHAGHTATLLPSGHVLVAGGYGATAETAVTELYDPATGNWSLAGNLASARQQHAAVALPSGKVLVAGGNAALAVLAEAELFDPVSKVWVPAGNMATAAVLRTATLLPSGEVLLAGGSVPMRDAGTFALAQHAVWQAETYAENPGSAAAGHLVNLSTRGQVQTGDGVMIAGFVISGASPKTVLIRAVGPNLTNYGVSGVLADPKLDLYSGQTVIASNDDWQSAANAAEINATSLAPVNAKESAILSSLNPGAYTAIVSGVSNSTGVAIVEVYEIDHPEIPLSNFSAREQVLTGDKVMIGGFIIAGSSPQTVLIRAGGPSLSAYNVAGVLANPKLDLYSGQTVIATNDDWQIGQSSSNTAAIQAAGLAPVNSLESAILITLQPGAYTAVVSGSGGGTGVGILEVFAQ